MRFLYKLFLTFNSTYLIIVVYLVNQNYCFCFLNSVSKYYSWALFFLIPIVLTWLSFFLLKLLDNDTLLSTNIKEIELANNAFLPTYLGYFFVSLGISNNDVLFFVFAVIFVFTYLSQTLYFNPIFLLFGYYFYFLTKNNDVKIFLITKKQLKSPQDFDFNYLKRINDYTFIDIEK